MRALYACSVLVAVAAAVHADPPAVTISPDQLRPVNGYVMFVPGGNAKGVSYVSLDGAFPVPSAALADKRMFLLPVQGLKPGNYRFVAVGSLNDEHTQVAFTVPVGDAPPVPPDPKPPDPKPPDPVPPQPVTSFYVLLVRETGTNLTPAQNGVFYGKEVEEYLTTHCTRDGNYVGWRRRDKDAPTTGDTATMNSLWGTVKAALGSTYTGPVVAFAVNGKVTIEPLPAGAAEMKALVDKYKGGK